MAFVQHMQMPSQSWGWPLVGYVTSPMTHAGPPPARSRPSRPAGLAPLVSLSSTAGSAPPTPKSPIGSSLFTPSLFSSCGGLFSPTFRRKGSQSLPELDLAAECLVVPRKSAEVLDILFSMLEPKRTSADSGTTMLEVIDELEFSAQLSSTDSMALSRTNASPKPPAQLPADLQAIVETAASAVESLDCATMGTGHASGDSTTTTTTVTATTTTTSPAQGTVQVAASTSSIKPASTKFAQQKKSSGGGTSKSNSTVPRYKCLWHGCGKSYVKRSHLAGHTRRHLGERPFRCEWKGCEWGFARSDELARHRRSHTGSKPHACSACTKTFTRADHLAKHFKLHKSEATTTATPAVTVSS